MALISPLKADIEQAAKQIDSLNRLYNVYFQGGEDDPPRIERKALDTLLLKIKTQIASAVNASDKFQANTMVNRYNVMCAKWDKHLRGIENGSIIRPKNREKRSGGLRG